MFKGTEKITIINMRHDRLTDSDTITCIVLEGCSWYETDGSTGQDTKSHARVIKVRIPEEVCQGYTSPDAYKATGTGWTLQKGDKIAKGVYHIDSGSAYGLLKGPDIMTVREIHDNRKHPLGHIYVEGD